MSLRNALTVSELAACVAERLAVIDLSKEQWQAETSWFLDEATGYTASERLLHGEAPVRREAISLLARWLDCRIKERTPIQYILGQAWFYGLKLLVTPDVLIPRPETELLVDEAIAFCRELYKTRSGQPVRVLDLCTGSGAIPLALKYVLKDDIQVSGADLSPEAVAVARQNASMLGLDVSFFIGDLFAPFDRNQNAEALDSQFDLIVGNPPYVDLAGAGSLTKEVVDHEPHMALFAPGHRLSIHERLIAEAPRYLADANGVVGVEIGYGVAEAVHALFTQNGYEQVRVLRDFAGLERLMWARFGAAANS